MRAQYFEWKITEIAHLIHKSAEELQFQSKIRSSERDRVQFGRRIITWHKPKKWRLKFGIWCNSGKNIKRESIKITSKQEQPNRKQSLSVCWSRKFCAPQAQYIYIKINFFNKIRKKMSSRVTISGDGLDHIGNVSGDVSGGRSNQSSSQRRQRSR